MNDNRPDTDRESQHKFDLVRKVQEIETQRSKICLDLAHQRISWDEMAARLEPLDEELARAELDFLAVTNMMLPSIHIATSPFNSHAEMLATMLN